jgi:hypothetical protein
MEDGQHDVQPASTIGQLVLIVFRRKSIRAAIVGQFVVLSVAANGG